MSNSRPDRLTDPFADDATADDDFRPGGFASASGGDFDVWQAIEGDGGARTPGADGGFFAASWGSDSWLGAGPGPAANGGEPSGPAQPSFLGGGAEGPGGDVIVIDAVAEARGGNGGGGSGGGGEPGLLTRYVSGDPGVANNLEYNIEIVFKGSWTVALQDDFVASANLIGNIIRGDVADVFFRGKVIDDISITAELTSIDGVGGILGQAGPTAIRTANYLPAAAIMQFDVADAATYDGLGLWNDIVIHEMLHCVGFGSIWDYLGLVAGSGTATPTFTGAQAMLAYHDLFGGGGGVPLEQDGGGTVESHWDEETFFNELMTGYIDNTNYLSNMTIASLEDLGYDTTWSPAPAATDPYLVT